MFTGLQIWWNLVVSELVLLAVRWAVPVYTASTLIKGFSGTAHPTKMFLANFSVAKPQALHTLPIEALRKSEQFGHKFPDWSVGRSRTAIAAQSKI